MIDVQQLLATIDLAAIVERYVPLKKAGVELQGLCPFHDERTPSFTVNTKKGFVHCFGCGAHHDAIGFLMRVADLSFVEACARLGADKSELAPLRAQRRAMAPLVPSGEVWVPCYPVPDDAPQIRVGDPCRIWNAKRDSWWVLTPSRADAYRDETGRLMGYVLRTEFADGKKVTPQVTWCVGPKGERRWCSWPFPAPRPLCGLDELAARPAAPVLVVEGEKCRAVGAAVLPPYVTICWPGGSKGIKHVDWSPVEGRDLVLWPDADQPGWAAMCGETTYAGVFVEGVAQHAHRAGAKSMRVVDTRRCRHGWDIADAIQMDGWTAKQLAAWAASRVKALEVVMPKGAS